MAFDETRMLFPNPKGFDNPALLDSVMGYHLMKDIVWPKNTYFYLHNQWGTHDKKTVLPKNHDLYVISWHMEQIDFDWLALQNLTQPVIVLSDQKTYDPEVWPINVIPLRWFTWHLALKKMIDMYGMSFHKDIHYKFSAFCNRISQNKLIVATTLLEKVLPQHRLVKVGTFFEEKNVHHWSLTGNAMIDNIVETFRQKYFGRELSIDDFGTDLHHHVTANPNGIAYEQAAINFTNESYHYSLKQIDNQQLRLPGPMTSEKTWKCLLAQTAFVAVGQYDTHKDLCSLGYKFDYGFDMSFDQIPGDIDRLCAIVELIDYLDQYSAQDLYEMTKVSTEHNYHHAVSGDFYQICESFNHSTLENLNKVLNNV